MKRFALVIVLLLSGCATHYDQGTSSANSGNYKQAFLHFSECAKQRVPACMNNAGVALLRLGNSSDARDWFTLAARYGNQTAIQNLRNNGWPVPSADLVSNANNNGEYDWVDALNSFLEGYNGTGGRRSAPQARALDNANQSLLNNAAATDSSCTSDFSCGSGSRCVKAPLASTGTCMRTVDQYGNQQYNTPQAGSVNPNMNTMGQCQFDTNCPIGFSCDMTYKVCVKQ